jgi:hypothetical protein
LTNGLYASTKTDSRVKVVSTQAIHFLIRKGCLKITKIPNMKNSTLWLLFTVFSTQNKNILIAIYVMRLDTNWGNCISYKSARYSKVMGKKIGFHRCHLR